MNKKAPDQNHKRPPDGEIDFHGAALIDEQGREIPITDDMVRAVLDDAEPSAPISRDA
jgi:hypothetical protein